MMKYIILFSFLLSGWQRMAAQQIIGSFEKTGDGKNGLADAFRHEGSLARLPLQKRGFDGVGRTTVTVAGHQGRIS